MGLVLLRFLRAKVLNRGGRGEQQQSAQSSPAKSELS